MALYEGRASILRAEASARRLDEGASTQDRSLHPAILVKVLDPLLAAGQKPAASILVSLPRCC
jgi:hypothetical protein